MIRPALALLALLAATPLHAAERRVGLGSFERVRVTGPFEVTFAPGSPGARMSGERDAIERVDVRVDGTTLTVRMRQGWNEKPVRAAQGPVTVALSSPALSGAAVFAGGRLTAARMKGARVDLSISGAGAIAVADLAAEQVNATVIGTGEIKLAGRAGRARVIVNGPGKVDAAKLRADDLSVVLDGPGEVLGDARYQARVTNGGLGKVAISGSAKCQVSARGGGPVQCGN